MGANMVRRLVNGGHDCVVYDVSLPCGRQIKIEDARGASTMERRRGEALDFWISPEACTRLEA